MYQLFWASTALGWFYLPISSHDTSRRETAQDCAYLFGLPGLENHKTPRDHLHCRLLLFLLLKHLLTRQI